MRFSKMVMLVLTALLLGAMSAASLADVPPYPGPRPPQPQPKPNPQPADPPPAGPKLVIKPNPGSPNAILTIPRKLLPVDALKKADASGFTPTQTVIAGLAMTAAVTLLGLQLVRRRSGRLALGMTGVVIVGGVAVSLAMANRAPLPPDKQPKVEYADGQVNWTKTEWAAGQFGLRNVPLTIRVAEQGESMELLVDPALLEPGPGAKSPAAKE